MERKAHPLRWIYFLWVTAMRLREGDGQRHWPIYRLRSSVVRTFARLCSPRNRRPTLRLATLKAFPIDVWKYHDELRNKPVEQLRASDCLHHEHEIRGSRAVGDPLGLQPGRSGCRPGPGLPT